MKLWDFIKEKIAAILVEGVAIFFVAALLSLWLPVWAATLIVFLLMLAVAGSLALVGFKKVRGVSAPKETIESVNELKKLVPGKAQKRLSGGTSGMYT